VSINSLLEYDDFRHVESDYMLVGRRSGRQFRMGDKVTIKIVAANLTKRQLDYEWVITAAEKNAFGASLDASGGLLDASRGLPPAADGQDAVPVHKKAVEHGGRGRKQTATRGATPQKQRKKKK
jgi:hypothetical protein